MRNLQTMIINQNGRDIEYILVPKNKNVGRSKLFSILILIAVFIIVPILVIAVGSRILKRIFL